MSQLTHPRAPLGSQIRSYRRIVLAAVLAGLTVALVVALAIGDGGPEETGVAAAIAPGPALVAADGSRINADLTFPGLARDARATLGEPGASRPDESAVAAAVSGD
jgi:hypothetical protein